MHINLSIVLKRLEAANRLGSAVTIPEIPDQFKMLKIIGRGSTSIVLEKDSNTVIVLTRDDMKSDWLNRNSSANFLGTFAGLGHSSTNFAFRQYPIKAYSLPKLYPLNSANKRKVKAVIKEFNTINYKYHLNRQEKSLELYNLCEEYELTFNKKHELSEFANFIINYDQEQYYYDLHNANFMQDASGNLIINDPVASKEIVDTIKNNKRSRREVSRLSYDRGLVAYDNLLFLNKLANLVKERSHVKA